jgi:hypothetical protein
VVFIPENELDENELARHLWLLAAPGALEVLFVSLSPGPEVETYQRLRLASLVALVRDDRVKAWFTFASGETWPDAARELRRPGDLLVWIADQDKSGHSRNGRVLVGQISDSLGLPVFMMGGIHLGPSLRQLSIRKEWIAWTGFVTTLVAFGWVQLQIQRSMTGTPWTLFMALSVLVELAVLWKVNERTL